MTIWNHVSSLGVLIYSTSESWANLNKCDNDFTLDSGTHF